MWSLAFLTFLFFVKPVYLLLTHIEHAIIPILINHRELEDAPRFYSSLQHLSHLRILSLSCYSPPTIPGATEVSALGQALISPGSLLEELRLSGAALFDGDHFLPSFARALYDRLQQMVEIYDEYTNDEEPGKAHYEIRNTICHARTLRQRPSSRVSCLKRLRLAYFSVKDNSTFTMLLAVLAPLSCHRPSSVPSALPHSSSFSRLVEIDLSYMTLSPPALRSLVEEVQRGAPWPALTSFTLTFCDFYNAYTNALSDFAILPLLQMFANPELTPRFYTLGFGFIHWWPKNGGDMVLKSLCLALRNLGPRLRSLFFSPPFMTKEAFAILTSSVNITAHDPSLSGHHASSTGNERMIDAGQLIDDDNAGSKHDGGAKVLSPEQTPAAVPMSPTYPHLQRLKLVFSRQIECEALAFHEWSLDNFPALEHLDLRINSTSPAIFCSLLPSRRSAPWSEKPASQWPLLEQHHQCASTESNRQGEGNEEEAEGSASLGVSFCGGFGWRRVGRPTECARLSRMQPE